MAWGWGMSDTARRCKLPCERARQLQTIGWCEPPRPRQDDSFQNEAAAVPRKHSRPAERSSTGNDVAKLASLNQAGLLGAADQDHLFTSQRKG